MHRPRHAQISRRTGDGRAPGAKGSARADGGGCAGLDRRDGAAAQLPLHVAQLRRHRGGHRVAAAGARSHPTLACVPRDFGQRLILAAQSDRLLRPAARRALSCVAARCTRGRLRCRLRRSCARSTRSARPRPPSSTSASRSSGARRPTSCRSRRTTTSTARWAPGRREEARKELGRGREGGWGQALVGVAEYVPFAC